MRIIAGQWKGRRLAPIKGKGIRPTSDRVREAWMSIVAGQIPGAHVLDLFSGSGALGLEALSRGAERVTFVDKARSSIKVLEANITSLGAESDCEVIRGDALAFLRRPRFDRFDLAFADPPYGKGLARSVLECFGEVPFADYLWVEHRSDEDVPQIDGAEQRRYGDTVLTGVARSPVSNQTPQATDES